MKGRTGLFVILAVLSVIYSSCPNPTDSGITINGTVTATSWYSYIGNPVTITVVQGSSETATEVTLTQQLYSQAMPYVGTFSITGVPKGSYVVRVSFTCTAGCGFGTDPGYAVDGGSTIAITDTQSNRTMSLWTLTSGTVSVERDMRVDIDMGTCQPPPIPS
ncbi:MAG TPA: hypothetical protein VMW87_14640 [Spirochaetia bacterium]|nr:hypothetical protein [Spirochaetia bacterium]